jgi:hypothetical protein
MQTLPANHPLAEWVQKAIRNIVQNIKFISNLGNIVRRFPDVTATSMETIVPRIRPPWWTPPIQTHIESTKEIAKKHHDTTIPKHDHNTTICIYTDGSGINSNIGAAAYCPTTATTSHQYLGKDTSYNVYAAELSGIYQATNIVKNSPRQLELHKLGQSSCNNCHSQARSTVGTVDHKRYPG